MRSLLLAVSLAAGCTVGPDFRPPGPPADEAYQKGGPPTATAKAPGEDGHAQVFARADAVRGDWYALFDSPALDRLIADALDHSPTIAAGRARLAAAREAVNAARGQNMPQLDAGAGAHRERASGTQFGISDPHFTNTFTLYRGQLALGYDVDAFGKRRREIENRQARYTARQYRLLDTALTLIDNVVATVLAEAGLRASLDATRRIAEAQSNALEVIAAQERYGAATSADTARARAQLATTRARLPELRKQLRIAHNRLALLTGQTPAQFEDPGIDLSDLRLPNRLPLALPSQLVARRPDILAASSRMRAANAQIGIAQANLLPDLRLDASYSRAALAVDALSDPASVLYDFGASVTAPLFHGGTLRAQKRAASDRYRAAAADYRGTVLQAFREVADSLAALEQDAETLAARQSALKAARESEHVVRHQVEAGAAAYLPLFTAQAQYQQAQLAALDARLQRYRDSATLLRALGGGWWHEPPAPAAQAAELGASDSARETP